MLMKTAVVDDMQSEALLLEGFLKEYSVKTGHDMDITFFSGGESFLEAFEKEDFDLIFMDIYMNGISGVEVSKKLWESGRKYVLVFLTSSSEHMSDAFACHAFDYLLKPVTYERLERVMNDITRSDSTENIRLTNGREEFVLPCSSFVCAYSADHYIILITSDGVSLVAAPMAPSAIAGFRPTPAVLPRPLGRARREPKSRRLRCRRRWSARSIAPVHRRTLPRAIP